MKPLSLRAKYRILFTAGIGITWLGDFLIVIHYRDHWSATAGYLGASVSLLVLLYWGVLALWYRRNKKKRTP